MYLKKHFKNCHTRLLVKRIIFFISLTILLLSGIFIYKNQVECIVKTYKIADASLFNQSPGKNMEINLDGKSFGYAMPVLFNDTELSRTVSYCSTDFSRVLAICCWVRQKLVFGNDHIHYYFWTPAKILHDAQNGKKFVCDGYARLAATSAQEYGIPSRVVWMKHHTTSEFYCRDLGKWVLVDPTLGFYLQQNNHLLSLTEILSCYHVGQNPKIVFYCKNDNKYPVFDKTSVMGMFSKESLVYVYSGENTEKGNLYSLCLNFKMSEGMHYVFPGSIHFKQYHEILKIDKFFIFFSCLIFFVI